eukprot:CAMPEP_0198732966 /NCGR_PEP_ID=MMETSP1475-20131203/41469_1 /TAXON_ID= ORGANISM="Unidentified sp., Strain CCMP1999" /NCGR_SAMPLE_ID=MMETSP1475 /ASSEMBLY_ACC=CAM_ASM_001111 /LENGTH=238 /DNA_ID=CAMNT_0044496179 /DNA_START=321 /DNA_END=1037 /DNA_ORIENTATION=+
MRSALLFCVACLLLLLHVCAQGTVALDRQLTTEENGDFEIGVQGLDPGLTGRVELKICSQKGTLLGSASQELGSPSAEGVRFNRICIAQKRLRKHRLYNVKVRVIGSDGKVVAKLRRPMIAATSAKLVFADGSTTIPSEGIITRRIWNIVQLPTGSIFGVVKLFLRDPKTKQVLGESDGVGVYGSDAFLQPEHDVEITTPLVKGKVYELYAEMIGEGYGINCQIDVLLATTKMRVLAV